MANRIDSTNIKHPNTFSYNQGNTLLVRNIEAINQSIRLILTTAKGELFGDPNFGCHLYEYIYEYEGDMLVQLLKQDITDNLNKFEPRIFVEESGISVEDQGVNVIIGITYNLRYTSYQANYSYIVTRQEVNS